MHKKTADQYTFRSVETLKDKYCSSKIAKCSVGKKKNALASSLRTNELSKGNPSQDNHALDN